MGRLRTELKVKSIIDPEEYQTFKETLEDAYDAASEHDVYFDLEPDENAAKVRKAFMHIADQEGISVRITRKRGQNSLVFNFKSPGRGGSNRMSAEESRNRIINALKNAPKPLKKGDIISKTGISASTWNIRVKELLDEGQVKKEGDRRDTTYTLAK